ncbi:MAG: hypothetical protein JRJ85_10965 [Deltaproteobacteria bacterium]|nr:hypothetical protein [Deltaproteobacteria bacterium]
MSKKKIEEEIVLCPVGRFFMDIGKASKGKAKFFKHMNQSRIEFLKAIRSLVDERIESFEKQGQEKEKKKAEKIEVH